MSFPATIPAAVVETIIAFLLPWLLPAAGDVPAARAAAIELLAEAHAQTARELRLAAEVIVHSFKAMALITGAPVPGPQPTTTDPPLKAAASLARHSHLAQRRLDELQRRAGRAEHQPASRAGRKPAATTPEPAGAPADEPHAGPEALLPAATQAEATASPPVQTAATLPPAEPPVPPELAQAETKYAVALQHLTLMKARWKGAPQPHTKAGQDIQRQQRLVDAARMALAQARQRFAEATAETAPAPA